jgi:hypothetical protein
MSQSVQQRATGWGAGKCSKKRQEIVLYSSNHTKPGAHLASCASGKVWGFSPWFKRPGRETDHSHSSNTEINNSVYTSLVMPSTLIDSTRFCRMTSSSYVGIVFLMVCRIVLGRARSRSLFVSLQVLTHFANQHKQF